MNKLFELKKEYEVGAGQTDCFGLCRPSALIEFMQDAATVHAEQFGISREHLIEGSGVIWLMARQRYFLSRPIKHNETVALTTWHRKTLGSIWYRDFEFSVSGEVVGGANSVWITADCLTKKMVDLSSIMKEISSVHPVRSSGPDVKKIRLPKGMEFSGTHTVSYSDLDINAHLNNVKVCDVLCNSAGLCDRMRGKYISEFQIGYLVESRPGDEITLCLAEEDGKLYIAGECGEERRFESFLVFGENLTE